jgi:coenzyme PQQ precursor peptide PqqA
LTPPLGPSTMPDTQSGCRASRYRGVNVMTWEAPTFTEVRMDAEINSYQDDFDREQDDRF